MDELSNVCPRPINEPYAFPGVATLLTRTGRATLNKSSPAAAIGTTAVFKGSVLSVFVAVLSVVAVAWSAAVAAVVEFNVTGTTADCGVGCYNKLRIVLLLNVPLRMLGRMILRLFTGLLSLCLIGVTFWFYVADDSTLESVTVPVVLLFVAYGYINIFYTLSEVCTS